MSHDLLAPTLLLAPLVAFAVALVVFRKHHLAAMLTVLLSGVVSAACALYLLFRGAAQPIVLSEPWLTAGGVELHFGVLLDGKTLIMGSVVAVITLCIQVYSLNYMGKDPGRGRFFAFLGLFEWAMLCFVFSPNLLQTFVFWELVGLASFFLIGFWYHKPTAVAAAKKAFIMTRIGDVGLFIGLILLFRAAGTLDVLALNAMSFQADQINLITALLFVGIVGKSAQFPLHTWLPDAMEGPTPVSALLHSATMVAAGVFLFARFHPLFLQAETTLTIVLVIATFTAVLSSTMAMVAKDMKRVLAFSSISQLGFMLMGLGAGSLFAGFFHLTTHAIFKALLFLCAGAYIHHFETNDMIAIGRAGGRKQRITTVGLIVGGAALSGIPPLAGFFSKELVIGSLSGGGNLVFLVGAYLASFMTAYYTFRMIFLVTRPNDASAAVPDQPVPDHGADHGADHRDDDAHHDHGAAWQLHAPIILLTGGAIVLGFLGDHIAKLLGEVSHHPSLAEMAPAIGVALSGVAVAWFDFGRKGAAQLGFIGHLKPLKTLFENGWYLDTLYKKVFVGLAQGTAGLLFGIEGKGFDAGADRLAEGTVAVAGATAKAQTGRLQLYIGTAIVLIAAACLAIGLVGIS